MELQLNSNKRFLFFVLGEAFIEWCGRTCLSSFLVVMGVVNTIIFTFAVSSYNTRGWEQWLEFEIARDCKGLCYFFLFVFYTFNLILCVNVLQNLPQCFSVLKITDVLLCYGIFHDCTDLVHRPCDTWVVLVHTPRPLPVTAGVWTHVLIFEISPCRSILVPVSIPLFLFRRSKSFV